MEETENRLKKKNEELDKKKVEFEAWMKDEKSKITKMEKDLS